MFMDIAHVVAKRSTCLRLNVGAVVVHQRRVVSIGYNGSPPGENHCDNKCIGFMSGFCSITIHAEINALKYVPENITDDLDMYVTDSPCPNCYEVIKGDGRVRRLFFQNPYRLINHLRDDRVMEIYRLMPCGHIVDFYKMELVDVAS